MTVGLGLGIGLDRRRRAGGTPALFPANEMQLGMGLTGVSTYAGYYPFANIMWSAASWEQTTGTGDWTQEWGKITADVGTDRFRAVISDGPQTALPSGTYTVINPDGCKIAIGSYSTQNLVAYTTATEFTFTYSQNQILAIWAEGSVTNSAGPIQIIKPGLKTAFQAGNPWDPDYLTFLSALSLKSLRFMDWLATYNDITEDWSEVPSVIPMGFTAPCTALTPKVHYSLIVDLCNRLNVNLWLNVPVRANAGFESALATFLATNLNSNLRAYLERGNEVWNTGAAFNDATGWTELYDFTRYEATPNGGISGWTNTAHGLTTGDTVAVFFTKENFTGRKLTTQTWPLGYGATLYVEAVDANNFKLFAEVGRTTVVPPEAKTVKIIYKKRVEAGKVASFNTNQGVLSLAMWGRMNAILGRKRCINVMGTQYTNATNTTGRLAPTGVRAATDVIAVAPYYSGDWFVGAVDISSGQLAPRAWAHNASTNVRIAVYANGSTPTKAQVLAGAGTGYVSHRDIPITISDRNAFTTGAALTGLTNSTTYTVFVIHTGIYNDNVMASMSVTVSATPSTVTTGGSYADHAARVRRHATMRQSISFPPQISAAAGIQIVCYESGSDYFAASSNTPAEVAAWRTGYADSADAGGALAYYYRNVASYDVKLANQFTDINGLAPGVFDIAQNFTDTSDTRYTNFAAFGGKVALVARPAVTDIAATAIPTEPSYPATVHTFADATLTYSIYSGDLNSNFAIVGNQLRLVNGTGVNWSVLNSKALVIEASNGRSVFINLSADLGTLAAGGVAAPTLTGSPTLLASWDFADDTKITNVSGGVSAISGSDGTSYSLSGPGSTANPTITTSNGKQVAGFASASSQKLTGAHICGITGAVSFVMIVKMDSTATANLLEVAKATGGSGADRLVLLSSSSTGFSARKNDSSSTQSIAAVGSVPNTTDVYLLIGTYPSGAATPSTLNVNGQGTAITGSPSSNAPSGMTQTSMGMRRSGTSTEDLFANMKVFRTLAYDGVLDATQREEIAVWEETNYGTANAA